MSDLENTTQNESGSITALIDHQREEARDFIERQQERLEKLEKIVSNEISGIHDSINGWGEFEDKLKEVHATVEDEATQLDKQRKEVEALARRVEAAETERLARFEEQLKTAQTQLESRDDALQKANEDVAELTEKLDAAAAEHQSLSQRIDSEVEERTKLRAKIEEAATIIKGNEERSSELKAKLAEAESTAQERVEAIESRAEVSEQKLKSQIAEATEWLGEREAQIATLESSIDEFKSDARRYKNQYEMESEALQKARSERDMLRQNVSTESSEGKQLRAMLNEATEALTDREHDVERLKEKLLGLSDIEGKSESLELKLSKTSNELEKLRKNKESFEEQAREAVEERDKKIARLKDQLSEASSGDSDAEEIRSENDGLREQLEKAAVAVKRARAERDELREEVENSSGGNSEEYERKIDKARNMIEDRDDEIQRLKSKVDELEADAGSFDSGIDEAQFSELKKRFEAAATKVGQLKTENENLLERIGSADSSGGATDDDIRAIEASFEKKLRAAEVELSLERAQNARAQTELREKLKNFEFSMSKGGGGLGGDDPPPRKKPRSLRESMGLD